MSRYSRKNIGTTGPTWSCTRRGFSCPDMTDGHIGIACATIVITDDAVVSYTAFSPLSQFSREGKSGCMFSVILSVPAGYCPPNPRLSRGVSPYGVRTFLPPHKAESGCLTNRLLLLDNCRGFFTRDGMQAASACMRFIISMAFLYRCRDWLTCRLLCFVLSAHA